MSSRPFIFLIVDNNRVSRKVYSRLLSKHFRNERCQILETESGEDALYFCEQREISCVLIDYHLPDLSCLEFLDRLKNGLGQHFTPVVILTGRGDESSAVSAMKSGAQDYLVKGNFSQELLAQAVMNAMEKVELVEELEKKRMALEHANQVLKEEIANRQKIESHLRLFQDLMNQTGDALFIIHPGTGLFWDFNDAACQNVGLSREELFQMQMKDLDHKIGSTESWLNLVKELRKSETKFLEGLHKRKDGTTFPVELSLKYITQDKKNYIVAVARDITQRKKVEERLRQLSNLDGLTGVYNRRFLDEMLTNEWHRLKREKQPLSVLMIDVDFFKLYNDSYGHQAGDQCLIQVATQLKAQIKRPADFVARYGGEEFCLVLPNTIIDEDNTVGEHCRTSVESLKIEHVKSQVSAYVTISIGGASAIPGDGNFKELIQLADQALYRAKELGRNRVVFIVDR